MTELRKILPGAWEDADVERVVDLLRCCGPLRLQDLPNQPELDRWPATRIEHAVVAAWSRNLIFIDARDLLVAL